MSVTALRWFNNSSTQSCDSADHQPQSPTGDPSWLYRIFSVEPFDMGLPDNEQLAGWHSHWPFQYRLGTLELGNILTVYVQLSHVLRGHNRCYWSSLLLVAAFTPELHWKWGQIMWLCKAYGSLAAIDFLWNYFTAESARDPVYNFGRGWSSWAVVASEESVVSSEKCSYLPQRLQGQQSRILLPTVSCYTHDKTWIFPTGLNRYFTSKYKY